MTVLSIASMVLWIMLLVLVLVNLALKYIIIKNKLSDAMDIEKGDKLNYIHVRLLLVQTAVALLNIVVTIAAIYFKYH